MKNNTNNIRYTSIRDFLYEKKVTKETFEIVTHDSIPIAQPVNFDASSMINNIKIEPFASKLKTLLIESPLNRTSPTISGYHTLLNKNTHRCIGRGIRNFSGVRMGNDGRSVYHAYLPRFLEGGVIRVVRFGVHRVR